MSIKIGGGGGVKALYQIELSESLKGDSMCNPPTALSALHTTVQIALRTGAHIFNARPLVV